jgi:hypothetical protein
MTSSLSQSPTPTPSPAPAFSILIVCDRYQQRLNVCLRNWFAQDVGAAACEILVSSSLADDGVRSYVRHLAQAFPSRQISLVENEPQRTKAEYQASLVARARGRVIALVDADMVFPPDFLSKVGTALPDGLCIWVGRAYLSQHQTYRAILGELPLGDPALFRRPLGGELATCLTYEKGPSGSCHVYTRKTFLDAGGYDGVEIRGGRYGSFAARFLAKGQASGIIRELRQMDDIWALHLWHGDDDGRANWNGAPMMW